VIVAPIGKGIEGAYRHRQKIKGTHKGGKRLHKRGKTPNGTEKQGVNGKVAGGKEFFRPHGGKGNARGNRGQGW